MSAQIDKFMEYFRLSGMSELDLRTQAMKDDLHEACETIKNLQDKEEVNKSIAQMVRKLEKHYDFAEKWIEDRRRGMKIDDDEEGMALKGKTMIMLADLQPLVLEYVSINFLLHHYLKISNDFVHAEEETLDIIPKMEWTSDTEAFLDKYLKKMPVLKEEVRRLKEAKKRLGGLGEKLERFQNGLLFHFGRSKGAGLYSAFLSAIRRANLDKAEQALRAVEREKERFHIIPGKRDSKEEVVALGQELANEYVNNMTLFATEEDKIFLKKNEVNASLEVAIKEFKQASDLIAKYHYSYLKSRVMAILRLQGRLETISDLDKLLELEQIVAKGMLASVGKYEDYRMFETIVTTPLDYMVYEKMKDLPLIRSGAEDVMDGLKRALQSRLAKLA